MELLCLGVGAGKTMVYEGEPSSAFLLRSAEGAPGQDRLRDRGLLLVDCGFGVARACLRHVASLPHLIYVSHNHTDHAGELPVILAVERSRPGGRRRTVVAERRVAAVLRERRLYETSAVGAYDADWILLEQGVIVPIGYGLAMRAVGPCQHTELCFGFVLYRELQHRDLLCTHTNDHTSAPGSNGCQPNYQAMFSFTADSGFSPDLFRQLAEAPVLLADGRQVGTAEHASFEELLAWQVTEGYKGRLVVYHYGSLGEAPALFDKGDIEGDLEVARPGELVARWDADGNQVPVHEGFDS